MKRKRNLSPKVVALLRKVQARLEYESKHLERCRFNMKVFGAPAGDAPGVIHDPICHTQACIGGELVLAAGVGYIPRKGGINLRKAFQKKHPSFGLGETSAFLLTGIGRETPLAARLFYFKSWGHVGWWPVDLEDRYNSAATATERAAIGVERIERFIASDGRE